MLQHEFCFAPPEAIRNARVEPVVKHVWLIGCGAQGNRGKDQNIKGILSNCIMRLHLLSGTVAGLC